MADDVAGAELVPDGNAPRSALVIEPPVSELRLDLGCGQNVREGYEGVDLNAPDPKHRVDLFKFPWPFADDSVTELHASHLIEHIPAREVEERDLVPLLVHGDPVLTERDRAFIGQDMLFAFFDECYRILKKPEGVMTVIWPALKTHRAFQDPTHRRFLPGEFLCYLYKPWRDANKLDHYRVRCNFGNSVSHSMFDEVAAALSLRVDRVQAEKFNESWNMMCDFHATLRPIVE